VRREDTGRTNGLRPARRPYGRLQKQGHPVYIFVTIKLYQDLLVKHLKADGIPYKNLAHRQGGTMLFETDKRKRAKDLSENAQVGQRPKKAKEIVNMFYNR
jgi:hypothetical protein